jgi:hypothetical protein
LINAYLTDDIIIKTVTYGTWGGVTTVSTTLKGRFEYKTRLIRDLQGEQVVSSARVYLPIRSISHKDKIVYESKEYSILNIEVFKDFSKRYLRVSVA